MMQNIFSSNGGIINVIRGWFELESIAFFSKPEYFRAMYVGSGIWQEFGFSSIVYLSAISSIPPELYEAAIIDGASRFQCARKITLPFLVPTITILVIMGMGNMMSVGFEKVFLMYSEATYEIADVISTYVYRRGLISQQYSFGTAVGLFNAVINFLFIIVFNLISRKVGETSLW